MLQDFAILKSTLYILCTQYRLNQETLYSYISYFIPLPLLQVQIGQQSTSSCLIKRQQQKISFNFPEMLSAHLSNTTGWDSYVICLQTIIKAGS